MTYSIPLNDPPEIEQEAHQCWSAAYESWTTACSRIIRGAQAVSEEAIEAEMARYPGALTEEGSATLGGVGLLEHFGNVHFEPVSGAALSTDMLAARLRQYGYIYMLFWARGRTGDVFSHAVVVSHAHGGRMRVMDPGRGRGLMMRPTDYYRNALAIFVGTHARAHET
ncbi:hypothetical protein [Aliiruegeria sabulilitoris]|uniref:hypothetical protein n=1 Tax=Aliiruegeria sabulilitoris TaxID=1510458 RepID=UPI00082E1B09|nr:hypothetical protein [Aliiruegeria sabulilitoris]NDR58280.1 hypothetical protein [Pseudoruegeria sp. M32A2M]